MRRSLQLDPEGSANADRFVNDDTGEAVTPVGGPNPGAHRFKASPQVPGVRLPAPEMARDRDLRFKLALQSETKAALERLNQGQCQTSPRAGHPLKLHSSQHAGGGSVGH